MSEIFICIFDGLFATNRAVLANIMISTMFMMTAADAYLAGICFSNFLVPTRIIQMPNNKANVNVNSIELKPPNKANTSVVNANVAIVLVLFNKTQFTNFEYVLDFIGWPTCFDDLVSKK